MYTPEIVSALVNKVEPEQVCTMIKLCSSSRLEANKVP